MAIQFIGKGGSVTSLGAAPKAIKSSKKIFNAEQESIPAKIARNLYKPVASTLSTLLGLPGDVYNLASSLSNFGSKYLDPLVLLGLTKPDVLPSAPDIFTSAGLKEKVTKPIGESIFGLGSQEKQPGFIEGATDIASQYAPYVLGGGAFGLAKGAGALSTLGKTAAGLGTNLLQGITGQGIKELGGGPVPQAIGEFVTGLGAPAIGKLTGSKFKKTVSNIAKNIKGKETSAWAAVEEKAKNLGKVNAKEFGKSLKATEDKLYSTVSPKNRKPITTLFSEIESKITNNKMGLDEFVNARKKINDTFSATKSGTAKSILKDAKNAVDRELDAYVGKIHKDAIGLSRTIKNSPVLQQSLKEAKFELPKGKFDKVKDTVLNLIPFAGTYAIYKNPKLIIPAIAGKIGYDAAKNLKIVMSDPTLRNAAFKSLKKISRSNVLATALKTNTTSKNNESGVESGPRGIQFIKN